MIDKTIDKNIIPLNGIMLCLFFNFFFLVS